MKKWWIPFLLWVFCACSESSREEQPKPVFSKLPAIEAPKTLAGTYVGRLPCEDCEGVQVKIVLDSLGGAQIEETEMRDSAITQVSAASYKDSIEIIRFQFANSPRTLSLKSKKGFSMVLLDFTGKEHVDESGEPYQLIRILNKPMTVSK